MRLRHRATFQRQADGSDGYGNTVQAWGDFLTVWGNLRETTGKETVAGGSVENDRTATLRVRKSTESNQVTNADRASVRGGIWKILGIANVHTDDAFLDLLLEIDPTASEPS